MMSKTKNDVTNPVQRLVMGPPTKGPIVNLQGKGLYLHLQLADELDYEILQAFLNCAEKRRYGKAT